MKKLAFAVFVGIFCLGATNAFAQTKKETTQEKIIRLEVENRVLNERVTALTQEIASLQSQLAAAKAQRPQATATYTQAKPTVKPYYANAQIQQKCEKYTKCAEFASKTYQYYSQKYKHFQITKVSEEQFFDAPGIFGGSGETVYKLWLYTNLHPQYPCMYVRWGKGQNPTSWKDKMELSVPYAN
ncbi:MAG: hypothetical protein J6Y17_03535 [Elusimicrobiaceae bacterium]|nr:hypothetical protein [Elusimicrobiaceae bacterium]